MFKRMTVCLLVSLLFLGLLAIAETAVPETPGAQIGGTLTIGVSQTFKDLDPRIMNSAYDGYVTGQIFDDLIVLDPYTFEPQPYVAKSWEVLSDDRVRFYLNEGIKFHNGEDLTAEDVAFTFNWIADPENNSPNFTELVWMQEVVVVDDYTVDVITKPDYAPFAPGFAQETQSIVPKDTVLAMGDEEFNLHPVGSGPYKFEEWKTGESLTIVRNEDYWLTYPNLDRVVYRPIPELSVMMLELEAGGIDIADNMPAQDVVRFQEMTGRSVAQCPSMFCAYMFFNLQHAPGNDPRFREAVYRSTNIDAAVFSIFQNLTGVRSYGCVPPAIWANDVPYLRDNVALEEDDARSKQLIAELKADGVIPEDRPLTVYCPLDPRRTQIATIIATNLIENGLNVIVQPLDWGPYLDLAYRSESDPTAAELDMGIIGWSGGPDPHDFLYYLFDSDNATVGSADNLSWYQDPEFDAWIKEADTTLDTARREELYVKAQRKVYEEIINIPLYHYIETRGLNDRVQGFLISPLSEMHICDPYHNVWVKSS